MGALIAQSMPSKRLHGGNMTSMVNERRGDDDRAISVFNGRGVHERQKRGISEEAMIVRL